MHSQVLEKLTRQLYTHLDLGDYEGLASMLDADCQLVDQVSRTWVRGRDAVHEYLHAVGPKVSELRSTLSDVSPTDMGYCGLVTSMLHQEYRYDGRPAWVTSPTTLFFVRDGDDWRIALLHSIPLPEVEA